MLLNKKINETDQKIMWAEAVHTCKCVIKSMATIGSTTSPFGHFYGEKPKIIASFPEFGLIEYVTKREKFRKQITDKTFKEIMVGYADNNTGARTSCTNLKPRESL